MACAEVVGFMKERNGRRSVVLLVRDGATTFHIPVPLADAQELAEEMLEAVEWARTGAERMDPYVLESILRASDVLDELAGILRAEGRDALADRLDDAWCAVRDVRCALRDMGPVVVTEAWRCSW